MDIVHGPAGTAEYPGGSPLNVAYGLGRLGISTGLVTALGNDTRAAALLAHLRAAGVHTLPGAHRLHRTSTATATIDADGTASYTFDLIWDLQQVVLPEVPRLLHIGSIAGFLDPGGTAVLVLAGQMRDRCLISFDPNIRPSLLGNRQASQQRFEDLAACSDVLKLSEEDAAWLYPDTPLEKAARHILNLGPALVVLTMGGQGARLTTSSVSLKVPAFHTAVADTIGAGDSYMAALIMGLLTETNPSPGKPKINALSAATLGRLAGIAARAAAITVSRIGATPPTITEPLPLHLKDDNTMTQPAGTSTPAQESSRPELHYTPQSTWLNDPNGLVYHKGTYHLYYQNNPFDNVWGNMSWGHATSADLMTWQERPVAIPCDEEEHIFSGSIVVDHANTSGFGRPDSPPLVAIYTSAYAQSSPYKGIQAQSLAYSLDDGETWVKYSGNPVLNRDSPDFRDPKVFHYADANDAYWVMVAVEATEHKVVLYRSRNLKDWEYLSHFGPANAVGGVWECPDLFPLPVDGDPTHLKWVLVVNINPGGVAGGSGGQYFIGDFDGVTFTADNIIPTNSAGAASERLREYQWLDWGRDYYAAVSFSNVPHNRRIMIAWMNNWDYSNLIPTSPWRGAMSLPREISLVTVDGVPHLRQRVAANATGNREPRYETGPQPISDGIHPLPAEAHGEVQLIEVEFEPADAKEVGLVLRQGPGEGTIVGFNAEAGQLIVNRTESGDCTFSPLFASQETAPVHLDSGRIRLEIYVDHSSLEVFAQDGATTITDQIFPSPFSHGASLYAVGGTAQLTKLTITPLQ